MPIRAENDPKFYRRFWIMSLVMFGFALWCLYDGAIAWPEQRVRALAYEELHRSVGDDPLAFRDQWHEMARQNNWPTTYPGEPRSEADIRFQFVMAGMAGALGLFLVSLPLRARGRWIELNETGLTSSWGQSVAFDQVVELNKRQWRSKGIAKVYYLDNGRKRRFVVDDYKFDRYPTDDILYELEQRIGHDKITGGPPEPPPEDNPEEGTDLAPEPSSQSG